MIYIVIPVHNRIIKTTKCLDSLLEQNRNDIKIVIVDDGSTDNTKQVISKKYSDVIILNGNGCLFWTGAIQLGISYVLGICNKNDWVLIANNDVVFDKNCIGKLISLSEKYDRKAIVGALSIDLKDKNTIVKSGTVVKSWLFNWNVQVLNKSKLSSIKSKKEIEVNLLTGRCLLHPEEVFRKIGNYACKKLPHYGGDDEFSARAKSAGYMLFLLPSAVVFLDQDNNFKNRKSFIQEFFVSKKSNINLIYKWRLTRMIVPIYAQPTYYIISIIKSLIQYFRKY